MPVKCGLNSEVAATQRLGIAGVHCILILNIMYFFSSNDTSHLRNVVVNSAQSISVVLFSLLTETPSPNGA